MVDEVKARSDRAPIVLTSNEWFRAKQLKDDYFLYVVLNAAMQPELYIIQNPANQITDVTQVTEVIPFLLINLSLCRINF
ncbi:hypothetical protein C6503_21390 [Candidatus Poribacteria bacterium]|nr:MAG: hypothetical protein C6503_21390 [Candidatus Poribacteria bacterium]